MIGCDYSLRDVALAASFFAFNFGAVDQAQDFSLVSFDVKESNSNNWREYNYIPSGINSFSLNAKIESAVFPSSDPMLGSFEDEMAEFWASLEDGSIFDNVGVEVWEVAKRIVAARPDIANYI